MTSPTDLTQKGTEMHTQESFEQAAKTSWLDFMENYWAAVEPPGSERTFLAGYEAGLKARDAR